MTFSDEKLSRLSKEVENRLSPKRFLHVLGVAKASARLAEFCVPELVSDAVAAALLHDVTKEYSVKRQFDLIKEFDIKADDEDRATVGVLHSLTAPYVIIKEFSDFATDNILNAVRNHTLGAVDMTEFDEVLFLADFIEENRTYSSSVKLRDYVWKNMIPGEVQNNIKILHSACIEAINSTVVNLIEQKKAINSKNILTRNTLLSKI